MAIDDEPLALKQISAYIERTPFLQLEAVCRSAAEAMAQLGDKQCDLLFVDINMPGLDGINLVRVLPVKPLVVFTTAYSEYAVEGFRVDAVDYLLKPISYPDFLRSAEKALARFRLQNTAGRDAALADRSLFVRSEYKTLRVDMDDIIYIESMSEYVRIYTGDQRPVTTLGSLRSYEERLPAADFMRAHRSYIVNLHKIVAVERRSITLRGASVTVPVGEMYEDNFRRYLTSLSLG